MISTWGCPKYPHNKFITIARIQSLERWSLMLNQNPWRSSKQVVPSMTHTEPNKFIEHDCYRRQHFGWRDISSTTTVVVQHAAKTIIIVGGRFVDYRPAKHNREVTASTGWMCVRRPRLAPPRPITYSLKEGCWMLNAEWRTVLHEVSTWRWRFCVVFIFVIYFVV